MSSNQFGLFDREVTAEEAYSELVEQFPDDPETTEATLLKKDWDAKESAAERARYNHTEADVDFGDNLWRVRVHCEQRAQSARQKFEDQLWSAYRKLQSLQRRLNSRNNKH